MTPSARAVVLGLVLLAAPALAAAESYARTTTIELATGTTAVDVYEPAVAPPLGVAVIAHGWTRSRERHRDAGRALAEAGVLAVVPDLPNMVDLWGNGAAIVDLVERLEAGALGLPRVDRASIVLIGTSAGGLATVWAASKLPGIGGWLGLDPTDRTGTGMYAASKLDAPAIVLLGDRSACNLFGSGDSLARSAPKLVRATRVDGASHCDFESPTNRLCTVVCGGSSREGQLATRRETVLAALELLAIAHAARPGVARPSAEAPAAAPDDGDDR
jgi:pimeloyl-ACP methyl ester carboxylesterase